MAMGISGGSPVFGPFAAAIVAGLSVASFLTLLVVPSLYLTLEDLKGLFGFGHKQATTLDEALGASAAPSPETHP
jgi:hypothetical protein